MSKRKFVVGIDPANKYGIGVIGSRGLLHSAAGDIRDISERDLILQIVAMVPEQASWIVCIERQFGMLGAHGAAWFLNRCARFAAETRCESLTGVKFMKPTPHQWRGALGFRTRVPKAEQKLQSLQFVLDEFGHRCKTHDEAEAICIAQYGWLKRQSRKVWIQ